MNNNKLSVSICMITYNHEPYIAEAINGVVMQKCDFPIELVIGEDCSTDSTRKICEEYADNFSLIKLLPSERNIGMFNNFNRTLQSCTGKYIAICEGDDYWIDEYKLQKQVDFLENNEDFGVVHADCNIFYQDKNKWEYNANKNLTNSIPYSNRKEIFYRLIDSNYKIRTATVIFRKDLLAKIEPNEIRFLMGDTPRWLDFSQITNIKYFNEVFSVYRILKESASHSKNIINNIDFYLSMAEMRVYYSMKYNYPINEKLKDMYNNALSTKMLFNKDYKGRYTFFKPSLYQRIKIKVIKQNILRQLFRQYTLSKYLFHNFLNKHKINIG